MLIDLRYHIITIVIIFVTLAIGILIGGSMVGNELISNEHKNLISQLEKEFDFLRNENQEFAQEVNSLEEKLAMNKEFQRVIMPLVLKEQLKEKRVLLVVEEGVTNNLKDRLLEAFRLADADFVEIIKKDEGIKDNDFDKVLLLGPTISKEKIDYSNLKDKAIKVDGNQIESISGLIKLVFEVASKELDL
ncbi:copper transporter [Halonatronum saccharophilum]|uniref:copper transporter n=1 Tax=Halonatronum saccharophilum TaxID=150060 RepID=UPI000480D80A|nr:copper transporter [Halonatronum saccharophilum]